MEFVKKSLLTLSMALFVTTPLYAVESEYIYKVVKLENKKTGEIVYVCFDIHYENYDEYLETKYPKSNNVKSAIGDRITSLNDNAANQFADITNAAAAANGNALLIVEGPFPGGPKKPYPNVLKKSIEDSDRRMISRRLYNHSEQLYNNSNIRVINAEVRNSPKLSLAPYAEAFVEPFSSKKLSFIFGECIQKYYAAYKKQINKLRSFDDGEDKYYGEIERKAETNELHRFLMQLVDSMNDKSPENRTIAIGQRLEHIIQKGPEYKKIEQQTQALQKQDIMTRQEKKFELLERTIVSLQTSEGISELLDAEVIHNIKINEGTKFVVAGGVHCENIVDQLKKSDYEEIENIEHHIDNPWPNPVPGADSQYFPVNMKTCFDSDREYLDHSRK